MQAYPVYSRVVEGHRSTLRPIEDLCGQHEHLVVHRSSHPLLLGHFLAGAGSAAFLSSFLAGAALASLLVAVAAGAAGVVAATVGVAGLASSFLAGSAAKAAVATRPAIRVARVFIIEFPFG